jgi:hypothetical protein
MIVVSFHTGPPYDRMAETLTASADRVGLAHDIVERPDRGCWVANTNQKPEVILDAMDRHPERPSILWVDADSEFIRFPSLVASPSQDSDAHIFRHLGYVWGSTMRFSNTPRGRELVETWLAQCRMTPSFSSDSNLKAVLDANPKRWVIGELPQSCVACREWIQGLSWVANPTIRHYGMYRGDDSSRSKFVVRKEAAHAGHQ